MNYKGIELTDISGTPQIIDPPRDMLVWDDNPANERRSVSEPSKVKVLAIVDSDKLNGKVIAETTSSFIRYGHCAEIPKPHRATYRELSKWLAQGNGEVTEGDTGNHPFCKTSLFYDSGLSDKPCRYNLNIRKWDDKEWHEPTIDYMGIEEAS